MSYVTQQTKDQLKNHGLVLVQEGEITAYYLKEEGTRMMSCLILFTPEGIAIMGDLTPQRNGSVSAYNYGLNWFSKKLSEDYLCSKFLKERWVSEIAEKELSDPENSWIEEIGAENCAEIVSRLSEHGEEWLYNELSDAGADCTDGTPGYGYDPYESSWLCAIQQRFAELIVKND